GRMRWPNTGKIIFRVALPRVPADGRSQVHEVGLRRRGGGGRRERRWHGPRGGDGAVREARLRARGAGRQRGGGLGRGKRQPELQIRQAPHREGGGSVKIGSRRRVGKACWVRFHRKCPLVQASSAPLRQPRSTAGIKTLPADALSLLRSFLT